MLSGTLWLTLATVLGLILGFFREVSQLDLFGASGALDGMVIALFLPEAVRIVLGGGALAAAMLPLWIERQTPLLRQRWSATQTTQLMVLSVVFAGLLMWLAPWVMFALAPGLSEESTALAVGFFMITVWCLPSIVLHSILAVIHQAEKQFFLQGLAGVFFNGPALLYLLISDSPDLYQVAWLMLIGSALMPLPLLPGAWRAGWRPFALRIDYLAVSELYVRLRPLMVAGVANQGVVWAERVIASFLGEGMIVLINFARKLINILSVVLMSLGQVLLSHFASHFQSSSERARSLLMDAMRWMFILLWPMVMAAVLFAEPLVNLLPIDIALDQLSLLAWLVIGFAASIPLAALNMLFARWSYAQGNTLTPTKVELFGMAMQALLAFALAQVWGVWGIPAAGFIATSLMAGIFVYRQYVPLPFTPFVAMTSLLMLFSVALVWALPTPQYLDSLVVLAAAPLFSLGVSGLIYTAMRLAGVRVSW